MATPRLTVSARKYLAEIGRKGGTKGGKARTPAKVAASQKNGHKGGRPRKNNITAFGSEQDERETQRSQEFLHRS